MCQRRQNSVAEAGEIGIVEIFQKVKPEHPAQADGHVRIAGEIEVDLPGVGQGPQPGHGRAQHGAGAKGRVRHLPQGVGQQHLFRKAHAEPDASAGGVPRSLPAGGDLPRHGGIPDDGPRHQLGKEGDVEGHPQGRPLRRGLAPVDVQHVAHPLEGEKRDADGKRHLRRLHRKAQQNQVFRQEPRVLEPAQEGQVHRHRAPHRPAAEAPPRRRQQAPAVIHGNGHGHQAQEAQPAPGVKQQAEDQQDAVPPPAEPLGPLSRFKKGAHSPRSSRRTYLGSLASTRRWDSAHSSRRTSSGRSPSSRQAIQFRLSQ